MTANHHAATASGPHLPQQATLDTTTTTRGGSMLRRPWSLRLSSWWRNFRDAVTDFEAGIISPEEARKIIAEYDQQRNLALASDIDLIRERMT